MPPTNAHEATETTAETTTAFLITKEYRRFEEFCNACRRDRYIGVCYGMPGVGKTLSARYYTRWDVLKDTDPFDFNTPVPPAIAECRTLFYTPDVTNSPRQIKDHLETGIVLLRGVAGRAERDRDTRASSPGFHETCELIIVDLTFRTPSDGDPRIFSAARFARTANSNRDMVSLHERRYVTHLCLRSVVWGSCYRLSKPTRSNICPL